MIELLEKKELILQELIAVNKELDEYPLENGAKRKPTEKDFINDSELLIKTISEVLGVSEKELKRTERSRDFVRCRRVYSKILFDRNHTKVRIGKEINRSHSAIIQLIRNTENDIPIYKDEEARYTDVLNVFNSYVN